MPTVDKILERKGRHVVCVSPRASVLDAAALMNEHRIGSLVVLDAPDPGLAGIITERDILRRIVVDRRDSARTFVAQAMTSPALTCTPETSVDEVRSLMHDRRIRHLPVVGDRGEVVGMVSIGDLNALAHAMLEETVNLMELFIHAP